MDLVVTERLSGDLTLWAERDGMTLAWPLTTPMKRRHVYATRVVASEPAALEIEGDVGGGTWLRLECLDARTLEAGCGRPTLVTCAREAKGEIPFPVAASDADRLTLLGGAMESSVPAIREAASLALSRFGMGGMPLRPMVLDAMTDQDAGVREAARRAIIALDSRDGNARSCHAALVERARTRDARESRR